MKTIVTFGEIMGRLNPIGHQRFLQSLPGKLELTFAGAEANVAASLAILGARVRYITALPENDISVACVRTLRGLNVDTDHVLWTKSGRLGLYFVEKGANQRPSKVIYDRDHSAIAATPADQYDWESIFTDARWLHLSGITPALSKNAFLSTLAAAKYAKSKGITVSCDLNFRRKLWGWESDTEATDLARRCISEILPHIDVVIANEEDASDVLGIHIKGNNIQAGELVIDRYPSVARAIIELFPNVSQVAITLRESHCAFHNSWGAMLYIKENDSVHFAPTENGKYTPYEIHHIIDRVGGGDSFAAGLVFALNTPELSDPTLALRFAVAASCLAHSIEGDFNFSQRSEVESLMNGSASGRVVR